MKGKRALRKGHIDTVLDSVKEEKLLEEYYSLLNKKGVKAKSSSGLKNLTNLNLKGEVRDITDLENKIEWLKTLPDK